MKTIGLIGGMSWESTQSYYRMINEGIKQRLGGLHSAKIVMVSIDFDPLEKLQAAGDWQAAGEVIVDAAKRAQAAGADCCLICTNTMHKVVDQVEQAIQIPLIHIADATGEVLLKNNKRKVGLLGTAFTMEQAFYKDRLIDNFGLDVVIPSDKDRATVHRIIYQELCQGIIDNSSKQAYVTIIEKLQQQGAQSVILGCTEIGLLVKQQDVDIELVDTTAIHAQAAVDFALTE